MFIAGPCKETGGPCLKKPKLLEAFQQSTSKGQVREGPGARSFVLASVHVGQVKVGSRCSCKPPRKQMLFSVRSGHGQAILYISSYRQHPFTKGAVSMSKHRQQEHRVKVKGQN